MSVPFACALLAILVLAPGASHAQQGYIQSVADVNQPPTNTVTANTTNFCAPMAATNITDYWDVVKQHNNAKGVNANIANLKTVAEYIGFFMDTNNAGSGARNNNNDGHIGTYHVDIGPGILDYAKWGGQPNNPPGAPALPQGCQKNSYTWRSSTIFNPGNAWNTYVAEINAGRPSVVCFNFWNPVDSGFTGTIGLNPDTLYYHTWGDSLPGSCDPVEDWSMDVGHAVTGVGYLQNHDPDGGHGPLPQTNWVIVHDNWASTPCNVTIPWAHFMSLTTVDPRKPFVLVALYPIYPPPDDYIYRGETLQSELMLVNEGDEPETFEVWIQAVLPNKTLFGPIGGPAMLTLAPGQVFTYIYRKVIPYNAPPGPYYLTLRVGDYFEEETYLDSDGYTFNILP